MIGPYRKDKFGRNFKKTRMRFTKMPDLMYCLQNWTKHRRRKYAKRITNSYHPFKYYRVIIK